MRLFGLARTLGKGGRVIHLQIIDEKKRLTWWMPNGRVSPNYLPAGFLLAWCCVLVRLDENVSFRQLFAFLFP